jgi:hypothetical protein
LPKRKYKTSSGKDIILTVILSFSLMMGFVGVYVVQAYYDTELTPETVFESDSDLEFGQHDYGLGYPINWYYDVQTAYKILNGADFFQYNKTAVYTGNNSWQTSVNTSTVSGVGTSNAFDWVMNFPNLDRFVIDNLTVSLRYPVMPDSFVGIYVIHFPTLTGYTEDSPIKQTLLYSDISAQTTQTSLGWYNKTLDIDLTDSLRIYDIAQETDNWFLFMTIQDKNKDGFSEGVMSINFEMNAQQISGWSIIDSLTSVIGGAFILNIIVAIFMLDAYDIGGYVRDLPNRKRKSISAKPRKKSKRKR